MATDFELQVLRELADIKSAVGAGEANIYALNERLFQDPTGILPIMHADIKALKDANLTVRVDAMESDIKDHKKWQNIKLIVAAVLQALGAIVGIHYKAHP